MKSDLHQRIYAAVQRIPRGRVATYGQVAVLAGLPRQPRLVGYALNVLPADSGVPWHRVVNAKGQVSLRSNGLGSEELQVALLKREGLRFDGNSLSLARYRFQPEVADGSEAPPKRVVARVEPKPKPKSKPRPKAVQAGSARALKTPKPEPAYATRATRSAARKAR